MDTVCTVDHVSKIVAIERNVGIPPHQQLADQITRLIAEGEFLTGHRLPPVRELATDLGLAANTVARVYRDLEAAGVVETRGRHGTVVCARAIDDVRRQRRELEAAARRFADTVADIGVSRDEALMAIESALRSPKPNS